MSWGLREFDQYLWRWAGFIEKAIRGVPLFPGFAIPWFCLLCPGPGSHLPVLKQKKPTAKAVG
ncbi:hypothetical protein ACFFUR_05820 [Echinicola jeungdonensis]|uniref:Uncharacterized protein n=1 Tax=Echinicola jeungdonensis TaxID=709343 RepID=A0ABV5J3D3_9BACT